MLCDPACAPCYERAIVAAKLEERGRCAKLCGKVLKSEAASEDEKKAAKWIKFGVENPDGVVSTTD